MREDLLFCLICFSAALSVTYNFCFARSYPPSHFQLLKTGFHAICLYVLSLLIIRHPLNALGNTCSRLDHYVEIQRQILFSLKVLCHLLCQEIREARPELVSCM